MIYLDSFLPEVRPFAPGVPDGVAYKQIRASAIEFCQRTHMWRFEDEYDVKALDSEIYTPNNTALHSIETVLFNGHPLTPRTNSDLDRHNPGWRTGETGSGNPEHYTQIKPDTMLLVPPGDGHLYVCFKLKPSQTAMELPDFLDDYRECIGWGALARILVIPGQSYTNPEMATYYGSMFSAKLDRLSTKGTTGQQNAPKRTRSTYY